MHANEVDWHKENGGAKWEASSRCSREEGYVYRNGCRGRFDYFLDSSGGRFDFFWTLLYR